MKIMTVEQFFEDGCGRCDYFATDNCKVNAWRDTLFKLRRIALESGLTEELKWSQPCYTFKGRNVFLISAFRDKAVLSFLKGALLKDPESLLESPGKNSQAARYMPFTDPEEVTANESSIRNYIAEAVQIEKDGKEIEFKKTPEPIPAELEAKFESDPKLRDAFYELTPGRQRGYVLYFNGAKQSKTRADRIEKYASKILAGKGFYDR